MVELLAVELAGDVLLSVVVDVRKIVLEMVELHSFLHHYCGLYVAA